MLAEFERLTGLPVVVNTSLNTAGRPMVDTPREAMELFGSAPVDLLAHRPVRGAPRHGVRRTADAVVDPDARPAQPRRACWTAARRPARPGRRPSRCCWSTTGRRRRPRRPPPADLPPELARHVAVLRRPRPPARPRPATSAGGRPATEWVAFLDDDVVPDPDWLRRAGRRPRRGARADVGGVQGRIRRAAARGPPADRLGAGHGRARRRRVDHRGHGVPAGGAGRGRRLRRAVPAGLPGGRGAGVPGPRRRLRPGPRRAGRSPTRSGRRAAGSASAPSAATPTTRCCAGCTGPAGGDGSEIPPGRRRAGTPRSPRPAPRRSSSPRPASGPPATGRRRRSPVAAWLAGTAEFACGPDRARPADRRARSPRCWSRAP